MAPPSDDVLLANFARNRQTYAALQVTAVLDSGLAACGADLTERWCSGKHQDAYRAALVRSGAFEINRNYDGSLRLIFAGIGCVICPGWYKGIEYIPGHPERAGSLVKSTDDQRSTPSEVYLRHIADKWYVFYQVDAD